MGEAIAAQIARPCACLCGETTLPELVGVLARARLLLTNDSGPMHVAAALGVPVVAVFGPTDWRETAPVGTRTARARARPLLALRPARVPHRPPLHAPA